MRSLSTLIREADADNPIARALEAILDSGLIIFSRDTTGRFVQLSNILSDRAGLVAPVGAAQPLNMKVFNDAGRLLAGSEYPASVTRTTGAAQRDQRTRIVSDDGRQIWLQLNTMPLERDADGWSVLTVATDITDLVDELDDARRETAARGELLTLSARLPWGSLALEDVADTFHDPLTTLLPGANVSFAVRDGDEFETIPIAQGYGELEPVRGRYTADERARWSSGATHVNLNVEDTDIYGANVVVEYPNTVRSLVIAPCLRPGGERLGSLAATSDRPEAFTEHQIASLEAAAQILAHALRADEPLARAS